MKPTPNAQRLPRSCCYVYCDQLKPLLEKKERRRKKKRKKKSKKDMKFEKLIIATEGAWAPRVRRRIIPKITIMEPIPTLNDFPFCF